jgi:CRP-like cAMP-binding protein
LNDERTVPNPPASPTFQINQEIISLDDFCALANRLVEQNLFDEAISLYKTASKIFPDSLALKLNLGRVQELQREHASQEEQTLQKNYGAIRAREDLLAAHYLSLASLYYSRGQFLNAIELLELSRHRNINISRTHFLLGKIYYDQGETSRALDEFLKVRELDPFLEDVYKYLGAVFYEKKQCSDALQCFVDAYILSGGEDVAKTSYYQKQIRMLLNELNIEDKNHYNNLFQSRKDYFIQLANSLSASKDSAYEAGNENLDRIFSRLRELERIQQVSSGMASELKRFPVMQGLTDEELIAMARICTEKKVKANEVIFREEDLTEGIYLIESGSVRIIKSTPFGEQRLASLQAGEFFGEMDFIDSLRCSADAIADEDCLLFSITKLKLEEMFLSRRHVAVQFYWHFWKTLAHRIREANEILKSFFQEADRTKAERKAVTTSAGESTTVDYEKKMALLREKGLSSKELRLLATFSSEEMYKAGQNIFAEGDRGDRLYIILEGQVRISKYIPGVGEEALAILERGDFFGEMALIDHAPRSADAKAHTETTVLPVESKLLTEILSRDVDSSYQFLYILCKILSRRLREINLKIFQWRMMSGRF